MTTVITGANGHIGGNLVRTMLEKGRDIRCVVYGDTACLDGLDVEMIEADVRRPGSLDKAFKGADTVYHLAAKISIIGPMGGLVHDTNVKGVRNMVRSALKARVGRVVHFSSVHAFEIKDLSGPITEKSPFVGPKAYAYDRSKALGHQEVLKGVKKGLDAVIVHPSGVIGPCDFAPSRMGLVFLDLYNRKFPALVDGGFNWVDARDVVKGAMLAEKKAPTGHNYILSGHYKSFKDLADTVHKVTGVKVPKMVTPMWMAAIGAPFSELSARLQKKEPKFTLEALGALRANKQLLHDRAKQELGYRPRPFKQSVKDIYAWFKEHGDI